jgi:ribosomal protein S21
MAYNRNQKHRNHSSTNKRDDGPRKPFRKKLGRHEFFIEGMPSGVKVPDPSMGTLERALKYLKRQMKDADVIGQYRSRKEYIKPSFKKRIQREDAIRQNQWKLKQEKRNEKGYVWTAIVKDKAR